MGANSLPPEADPEVSSFDHRAEQWLKHLHWAMDHTSQRLMFTSRIAFTLFAGQGALATFVATRLGDDLRPAWFAYVGSALALGVAMLWLIYVVMPRDTQSVSPAQYAELWWKERHESGGWTSAAALFVEELLQSKREGPDAVSTVIELANRRARHLRWILGITAISVVALLVGASIEVLADPWPDR